MAKELYEKVGTSNNFELLCGTGTEKAIGVALKPGNGVLQRGTIIQMDATGLYIPALTTKMASGACAVLDETVDTTSTASGTAPSARAYSSGHFLTGKLMLKTGALTAADYLELRRQGITTDNMDGTLTNEI